MVTRTLDFLQQMQPIVDVRGQYGFPNDYFIRQMQLRQDAIEESVPSSRLINTTAPLSGGGDLSEDRTLTHDVSGVTPGSYTNADVTIDEFGHVTAAANGSSGGGSQYFFPACSMVTNDIGGFATLANALITFKDVTVDSLFGSFDCASVGDEYAMFIAVVNSGGTITSTLVTSAHFTTVATGAQQHEFTLSSPVTLTAGTLYILALVLVNRTTSTACRALVKDSIDTVSFAGLPLDLGAMRANWNASNKRFWYVQNSDAPSSGSPSSSTVAGSYGLGFKGSVA